jgi:hypothetical protein
LHQVYLLMQATISVVASLIHTEYIGLDITRKIDVPQNAALPLATMPAPASMPQSNDHDLDSDVSRFKTLLRQSQTIQRHLEEECVEQDESTNIKPCVSADTSHHPVHEAVQKRPGPNDFVGSIDAHLSKPKGNGIPYLMGEQGTSMALGLQGDAGNSQGYQHANGADPEPQSTLERSSKMQDTCHPLSQARTGEHVHMPKQVPH